MTSNEIRQHFKRFDSFFHRVSNTKSIMDKEFAVLSDLDVELMSRRTMIEMRRLGVAYSQSAFDCEDHANLFNALFTLFWSHDPKNILAPPIFRVIIDRPGEDTHAVSIIDQREKLTFIEPQTGEIIDPGKVLEIA